MNFQLSLHSDTPLRPNFRRTLAAWSVLGYLAWPLACSPAPDGPGATGGAPATSGGNPTTTGGVQTTGGVPSATGGSPLTGGSPTGGSATTGGTPPSTGGTPASTGGTASGGSGGQPNTGGNSVGGSSSSGASGSAGRPSTGGNSTTGGAAPMGGAGGKGGNAGAGGKGTAQGGSAGAATTGGNSTTGGSGGATSYQPCPTNGDPCKILPLGDSITWGIQYDGAYRVELFNKAQTAGQKITFTGSQSNGPAMVAGVTFPKKNEGRSGWTISTANSASGTTPGISGLIPSPAFTTLPNIVLLMIGTNDVYAPSGQAGMADRLGALLDKIIMTAPDALLVVGKITPLANSGSNQTIKTYNDAIPGLVQTRASAGKHVIWVDLNTGFTQAMLSSDGVHPQKTGYDFMAGVWYTAISSLLPK